MFGLLSKIPHGCQLENTDNIFARSNLQSSGIIEQKWQDVIIHLITKLRDKDDGFTTGTAVID